MQNINISRPRHRWLLTVVSAVIALTAVLTQFSSSASAHPTVQTRALSRSVPDAASRSLDLTPHKTLSGAFLESQDSSGQRTFGKWRGRKSAVAMTYLGEGGWNYITNPTWLLHRMRPFVRGGGTLVLSVPMLEPGATMEAIAHGDDDRRYRRLAHELMSDGFKHTILRFGWEFNGCWDIDCVRASGPDDSRWFKAEWIHLVKLFRSYRGQHFRFDWCPANGWSANGIPASRDYPGDHWVTYIGVDVYDLSWTSTSESKAHIAKNWRLVSGEKYGLNWWAGFASHHHKQMSIPEWGININSSGGDDPYFIKDMAGWLKRHNVAFESYFDKGGSYLGQAAAALAASAYKQLFGSGSTI